MNQEIFEKIEAYLQGRMSVEEKEQFQQQLNQDPGLQKIMEEQLALTNAIETEGLKNKLNSIYDHQFGTHKQKGNVIFLKRFRPILAAASVALLVLAAWLIFRNTEQPNEQLFSQYYERPAGLPTTLGIQTNEAFSEGMIEYKLGNFSEAQQFWLPLLAQFPENDTLQFYLGINYLELSQLDSADNYLNKVAEKEESKLRMNAKWYSSLVQLRQEKKDEAFSTLSEIALDTNPFQAQASALLEELSEN